MGMRGNFSSNRDTACASIRYAHSPCSHSGVTAGTVDASWTYMYHRSAGQGRVKERRRRREGHKERKGMRGSIW